MISMCVCWALLKPGAWRRGGEYLQTLLGLTGARATTVKLSAPDGAMIELLHFTAGTGAKIDTRLNDRGLTHIALTVDDLDREYARLGAENIEFISPPETSPDGGAKVAFCRGPDGEFVELVQELK